MAFQERETPFASLLVDITDFQPILAFDNSDAEYWVQKNGDLSLGHVASRWILETQHVAVRRWVSYLAEAVKTLGAGMSKARSVHVFKSAKCGSISEWVESRKRIEPLSLFGSEQDPTPTKTWMGKEKNKCGDLQDGQSRDTRPRERGDDIV